jgi:hypothetical protein
MRLGKKRVGLEPSRGVPLQVRHGLKFGDLEVICGPK